MRSSIVFGLLFFLLRVRGFLELFGIFMERTEGIMEYFGNLGIIGIFSVIF